MNLKEMLFKLIKSAVNGEKLTGGLDIDTSALFKFSKHHDIAHIIGYAILQNNLIEGENATNLFENEVGKAVFRYELLNDELDRITKTLTQNGIKHIPLKGAVIRNYYKESFMRSSCDIDILVEECELERAAEALKCELCYTSDDKITYHDISLFSESGVHLELHYNIKENIQRLDKILDRVWEFAAPVSEGSFTYRMKNEYLLFHLISHTVYHFMKGGCGIKPFIDLYVLFEKMEYDKKELEGLLEKAGLTKFYGECCSLVDYWFNKSTPTELIKAMEKYILVGGVYGTKKNTHAVGQAKRGTGALYLLSKIFVSYNALSARYPVIKKWKILTPVFYIVRIFDVLFKKGVKETGKEIKKISEESDRKDAVKEMLKELEL